MKKVFQIVFILLVAVSCTTKKSVADKGNKAGKNKLSTQQQQVFRSLFHDANKFLSIGDYEQAFEYFNEALKMDASCGACQYQLSGLYDYQGRTVLAVSSAKVAVKLEPKNEWYWLQLAYIQQRNGKHEEAISSFKALIALDPNRAEYYFPMADSQLQLGQNEKAIKSFEKAESIMGTSEELSMQKHRLYLEMGKDDKAIEELQKLIKLHPKDVSFMGILAEAYEEIGEIEKALETYEEILEIDPQNGLVRLSLYDYFRFHGNSTRARKELRIAMTSEDVPIDAKMQIMLSYFAQSEGNMKKKAEAYDYLKIMAVVDSMESKTHTIYGDFLYRDGKKEEALNRYKKAVQLDPDHFSIWNQMMLIESELQDYDRMLIDSELALELYPTQPAFYFFNGHANLQKENYDKAIEILNVGKEYVIGNDHLLAEFHQNLAQAYHDIQDHSASDASFDKALIYHPDNAFVLNNYSYFLSVRKVRLDKAAEMSQKSNELMPGTASFLDTYGWILFQQGKYSDAEIWLSKSMNFGGKEDGTVLEHYGDVLFKLDKVSEAVDYWIKAKEKGGATDQIDKKIEQKMYIE
ncbi:MAG: tetratricopeptide repeat protein [Flavobacteriales bacterium]|nr:tetratricopeptide repeat protein [Flavobacteriales bacterium]